MPKSFKSQDDTCVIGAAVDLDRDGKIIGFQRVSNIPKPGHNSPAGPLPNTGKSCIPLLKGRTKDQSLSWNDIERNPNPSSSRTSTSDSSSLNDQYEDCDKTPSPSSTPRSRRSVVTIHPHTNAQNKYRAFFLHGHPFKAYGTTGLLSFGASVGVGATLMSILGKNQALGTAGTLLVPAAITAAILMFTLFIARTIEHRHCAKYGTQ